MLLRKYFFVFLMIFLLCGCSSEYILYVSDDKFDENIHIEFLKGEDLPFSIDNPIYVFHNDFETIYEKNTKLKDNMSILDYNYSYSPEEFVNANSFNACFNERNIIVNNDEYFEFNISKYSGCVINNDFDIKIKTNNKVLENNADEIDGNTYIWHLNEKNRDKININIKIAKGIIDKSSNSYIGYILLGFFGFLIFIIILLFMKKRINRNSL